MNVLQISFRVVAAGLKFEKNICFNFLWLYFKLIYLLFFFCCSFIYKLTYEVFITQLIRYARACRDYANSLYLARLLTIRLL